jgi:hypothetical protein
MERYEHVGKGRITGPFGKSAEVPEKRGLEVLYLLNPHKIKSKV